MPHKVSRVVSKPTKTIAKASSSSKSTSKSSSTTSSKSTVSIPTTSTVRSAPPKPAPALAQKPRNVDKVDFGKPKPTASAGTYKPTPAPKSIAATKTTEPFLFESERIRQKTLDRITPKCMRDLDERMKNPHGPQIPNTTIGPKPKPKPADDPSNQDYNPMIMTPSQRQAVREMNHEKAKEASKNEAAQNAVRATAAEAAGQIGGAPARIAVGAASFTETGKKIVDKTVEIIVEGLEELGRNMTFDEMP